MFDELSIWEIGFTVTVIPLERRDTSSVPEICLPGPLFSSQRKEFTSIAKWDREVCRRHANTRMDDVWARKVIRFWSTYWAPFCGSPGCGVRNKQEYFFSAQWRGRGSQNHSSRCCPHQCRRNSVFLDTGDPEMSGGSPSEHLIYLFQRVIIEHYERRHMVQKGTNFFLLENNYGALLITEGEEFVHESAGFHHSCRFIENVVRAFLNYDYMRQTQGPVSPATL